ncbi:MAG TPA: hypothetical protein VJM47_10035 [Nitrosospira sp.]|nr:hypothetical protein [Nitrosospira sp.]
MHRAALSRWGARPLGAGRSIRAAATLRPAAGWVALTTSAYRRL